MSHKHNQLKLELTSISQIWQTHSRLLCPADVSHVMRDVGQVGVLDRQSRSHAMHDVGFGPRTFPETTGGAMGQ